MRDEHLRGEPRVSVVTPFYNTAPYIAACIESVLGQTHSNFEYLLVDNRSTDGSRDIAARYAARDGRIRLIDNAEFLGQLANFNRALEHVDPASRYVKMLLADDVLFPDGLSRLVADGRARSPRRSRGRLLPARRSRGRVRSSLGVSSLPGREALRRTFLAPCFLVGTPSTVLYRADIVRSRRPFFTDRLHADTEAAYEILLEHHLGFVHQVLSFVRTDNESISSAVRDFFPIGLDNLIVVERFGRGSALTGRVSRPCARESGASTTASSGSWSCASRGARSGSTTAADWPRSDRPCGGETSSLDGRGGPARRPQSGEHGAARGGVVHLRRPGA
jgi:glycosyltransferase involved in cell wall biosynthesis